MRNKPKFGVILVIILVLALVNTGNGTMYGTSYAISNDTGVCLSKGAVPTRTNEWKVTLTIDGSPLYKKSDVVLVIDSSGSMSDMDKMKEAKKSAIQFVDYLLEQGRNTRIAVVTFGDTSKTLIDFTNKAGIKKIKSSIQNIKADGGTHMQAGIYEAETLLAHSEADIKTIVLLGDGEPNFSFRVTRASGISISECKIEGGIHKSIFKEVDPFITQVDPNATVGKAGSYSLNSLEKFKLICPHGFVKYSDFPANNGIPTIYEAEKAIAKNINIYSIAFGEDSDTYGVLKKCQNYGYYKLSESNPNELDLAFTSIAGNILSSTLDGVVEDLLGDKFKLIQDSLSVSQGTVSYHEESKKIIWTTGKISEDESATMTYKIKLQDVNGMKAKTWYPTNRGAEFHYTYGNGYKGEGVFPIPMVEITIIQNVLMANQVVPALQKEDHYAYVVGYPDGLVRPLGNITREEVAVIFYRLMTEESREAYGTRSHNFKDVKKNRWSEKEIATLTNAKIITGYFDGTFKPKKFITRAEFATICGKFDHLEVSSKNKFTDINGHWAKDYINSSVIKGWINGYGDGSFRPDQSIIRCEAMKLINEALNRRVNQEGLHPEAICWPDNKPEKWYYEIIIEATNSHEYEREENPKAVERWTGIKENPVW